jgi:arylsulfatase A-like enzyme
MKFRRIFLVLFLISFSSLSGQDSPNIIFLFFDDLNIAGTTLGGDPQIETPNIQRLADMGVNFTNAHSNSTICSPSRASVLNGLYPHTSGYYGYAMGQNVYYLNPVLNSVDDVFAHFKNNGYNVYGSGKVYHGTSDLFVESFTGFGEFILAGPFVSIPGNSGAGFHTHPSMPADFSNYVDGVAPLSDIPTFENYTGWVNNDGTPYFYENDSVRDKLVDEIVLDYGLNILENNDENIPLFLTLGIQRPHSPFYLPKKYFDMYPISDIQLPDNLESDLDDVPVGFMNNRWNANGGYDGFRVLLEASADSSDQQWWLKRYMQGYYAGISFVDDLIGQLLDSLESQNLLENTYIVLTSDHGYHLGEKSLIKKTTLYDNSTRIPLIIAGPNMAPGSTCIFPVSLINIYPTLVDLAEIPTPDHQLDGISLKPLLQNPLEAGPEFVISHLASDERIPNGSPSLPLHQHHSIRTIDKRYTLYATGEEEFYDYVIDPNEWFNLAGDSQYESEQQTLRNYLIDALGIATEVEEPAIQQCFYHGGFEQRFNGWKMGPGNFSQVEILSDGNQTEGENYVRMNSNGATTMKNSNLLLENGTEYSVSFDARSDTPGGEIMIEITSNQITNIEVYQSNTYAIGTEWDEYVFSFEHTHPTDRFNTQLRISGINQAIFDIDNIQVLKLLNPNNLNPNPMNLNLEVFPNPVIDDVFQYRLSGNTELLKTGLQIGIYNQLGTIVYETHASNLKNGTVLLPQLQSGVYFVQFSSGIHYVTRKISIIK